MMDTNTMFRPLADDEIVAGSPAQADEWRPITPVPADAPPLTTAIINRNAPAGFTFTAGWRYNDTAVNLLGCVVRYDKPANGSPAEKQVKPFTFCEGPNGVHEWRNKS